MDQPLKAFVGSNPTTLVMTLTEMNTLFREEEIENLESAALRLSAILALLRSINQDGKRVSNDELKASFYQFRISFGEVCTENVDRFFDGIHSSLKEYDWPPDFLMEVI